MALLRFQGRLMLASLLIQLVHVSSVRADSLDQDFQGHQKVSKSEVNAQSSESSSDQDLTVRQTVNWEPLVVGSKLNSTPTKDSSETIIWEAVPNSRDSDQTSIKWEVIDEQDTKNSSDVAEGDVNQHSVVIPRTAQEAEDLLRRMAPTEDDFQLPLRLGPAVPTANQLPVPEVQLSTMQLSPFSGGEGGGTGNQNYAVFFDVGFTESVQLSGFYSQADDPLFAPMKGFSKQPGNLWESYGGSIRWRVASDGSGDYPGSQGKIWNLAISGSLEGWHVGSGGCDSFQCKGQDDYSPNIFNDSGKRVSTTNLIGSVAVPFSWNVSPKWQLSIAPGASFLPATQGEGQGGSGTFYGNNVWLSGGALWRPISHVELFGSSLVPFGPGTNSFDESLNFSRVPIFTGGLNWRINPRIGLEGSLTNGWGASPATALLSMPSSNQLGYSARFHYTAGAADSPQPLLTERQFSLATGGLTVNTALVPPDKHTQIWFNNDSNGNVFGFWGHSISNAFQLDLYQGGFFKGLNVVGGEPSESLANTFSTNGGWNWRVGGKAVAFSPLRGAPLWGGGRISLGRNNDATSYQGYVFAETMNTWEANTWLALNVNPKLAWSGVGEPWGVGLGANIQLGQSFQLIPEINLVGSQLEASNATFALRWLAKSKSIYFDLYASNAAGLLDMGQLMRSQDIRYGARVSFIF